MAHIEPQTDYTIKSQHRCRLMDVSSMLDEITTHDHFEGPEPAKAAVDEIIQLLIGVHNEME